MIFSKPPLSFEQQADLLLERGIIADKEEIINYLSKINYYKLSGYWKTFQNKDNSFQEDTHFKKIIQIYNFDSILKNILMEAIASIETSLKTSFANILSKNLDPFFYTEISNFSSISQNNFDTMLDRIKKECNRSKESFIKHFKEKYGDSHNFPPAWSIVEVISFGTFVKVINHLSTANIKKITKIYNLNYRVFKSWLWSINEVRNICAHHSRLWNKRLGFAPSKPRNSIFSNIYNRKIFFVICIFLWLDTNNRIKSEWFVRLKKLIKDYNEIPLISMGFPNDWETLFDNIIKQRKAD